MTICFDGPIQWRGNTYESGRLGVTDDGHFVLDLRSSGRYHTMIPISAHNYTQAAMRDDGECLTIFDNWGSVCRIAIPREAIKAVLAEAAAHEIPILTEHD